MFWLCLSTLQLLCIIQGTKYRYIANKANYDDARRFCEKRGLDLVKVTSREVQQDLNDFYKKKKSRHAWLGVHYNGEGFGYSDGTALRYTDWDIGEPNDLKTDHCVVMTRKYLKWRTRKCDDKYPSLCEQHQHDDGYKVKVSAHKRWQQGKELTRDPTYVAPQTSLRSCAKDCAILKCHYFSLDGKECKMYTDDTDLETQAKKGSAMWKRN